MTAPCGGPYGGVEREKVSSEYSRPEILTNSTGTFNVATPLMDTT